MSRAVGRRIAGRRSIFATALIATLLLALPALCRAATTITVTSTADTSSANCVLRDAITVANDGGGTVNGCTAGSDTAYTIQFASGVTGTIMLGSVLPDIESDLTINGPTSGNIAISGNNTVRVMTIDTAGAGGHTVTLSNLTIENGASSGSAGGGIVNLGTLTITNSTFSGNSAAASGGGGIDNLGALTVTNSTFSGNSARGVGGGIENAATGPSSGGTLTVTNSTFSGNSAGSGGGGIENANLVPNSATLKGTILASETGGNCGVFSGATITDGGYNISDDTTCGFATSTGASGQTLGDGVSPLLASGLANNGGPTQTIAELAGSPSIDAIPFTLCTYPAGSLNPCTNPPSITSSTQLTCDQRGEPRPDPGESPAACDIGAYELQDTIAFAGQPGKANCHGQSVSALAKQYGGMDAAASALGYPSVKALQAAISQFCGG